MSLMPLLAAALTLGGVQLAPAAEAQRHGGRPDARHAPLDRSDRVLPGHDTRRGDRRCGDGTGNLIGALAGGLLGRPAVGRGERTRGRIGRSDDSEYCR